MPDFYADPVAQALSKVGNGGWEHGWQRVGKPGTLEHALTMQRRAHAAAAGHLSELVKPGGCKDPAIAEEAAELDEQRQEGGEAKFAHPMHSDPVIDRLNLALTAGKRFNPDEPRGRRGHWISELMEDIGGSMGTSEPAPGLRRGNHEVDEAEDEDKEEPAR